MHLECQSIGDPHIDFRGVLLEGRHPDQWTFRPCCPGVLWNSSSIRIVSLLRDSPSELKQAEAITSDAGRARATRVGQGDFADRITGKLVLAFFAKLAIRSVADVSVIVDLRGGTRFVACLCGALDIQ